MVLEGISVGFVEQARQRKRNLCSLQTPELLRCSGWPNAPVCKYGVHRDLPWKWAVRATQPHMAGKARKERVMIFEKQPISLAWDIQRRVEAQGAPVQGRVDWYWQGHLVSAPPAPG